MYDHALHFGRKHFCRYSLEAFRTAEKLKFHIKECFKVNCKQTVKVSKKVEYIKFKKFGKKTKIIIHSLSRFRRAF